MLCPPALPPPYGGGQIPPCVNGLGKTLISSCFPNRDIIDLRSDNDAVVEMDKAVDSPVLYSSSSLISSDLVQVAYQFGKYLYNLPCHTATASIACKHVFEQYPSAREILNRHGKLHGLTKVCH